MIFAFDNYGIKIRCGKQISLRGAEIYSDTRKTFITYPLIDYRYLKNRVSTTMPLKPQSDERAGGDLPRKSLCAA